MATEYSFITKWKTTAPIEDAWDAIRLSLEWPGWWPCFEKVTEKSPGDVNSIGSIRQYTLKSPTGYRITFDLTLTDHVEHKLLAGTSSGELEGTGNWLFEVKNGVVYIDYLWKVRTQKTWMNAFAFILKPAFVWNHRIVMKNGARFLAKKLGHPVNDIT